MIDNETMTIAQVAALLDLFKGRWDDGETFGVTIEPWPEVPEAFYREAHSWWAEQGRQP